MKYFSHQIYAYLYIKYFFQDYVDFSDNKYADPAFQFTDKKLMKDIESDDHVRMDSFSVLNYGYLLF